jgi:hypothetical protein
MHMASPASLLPRKRRAGGAIRRGCLAAALVAASTLTAVAGGLPDVGTNPWTMCAKATNRVERQAGIPRQLLRAISKAESGRLHHGKKVVMAWPWTVMAEGRGRYLDSKAEAIAEVERLQARGVKNIDVGCMQVNLQYHPHAFASLQDAFDPLTNVGYAASFLRTLAAAHGSWAKGAAYYHSQNPQRYRPYRTKVRAIWATEREKYRLALDRLRSARASAPILAGLMRADAPIPNPATPPLRGIAHPRGPVLLRATATASSAWPQPADGADPEHPAGALVFQRAGPVRLQVVADLR